MTRRLLTCKVERSYLALTIGLPKQASSTVETNIGRDLKDPKKMAPFGFYSSRCAPCLRREVLHLDKLMNMDRNMGAPLIGPYCKNPGAVQRQACSESI